MADFYTEMAEVAETLIEEFGRDLTVTKSKTVPLNYSQPHRGLEHLPEFSVTAPGVFVATSGFGYRVTNEDNLKRSDQIVLFAANNDEDNELENADKITDGEKEWGIVFAEVLSPGDTRLLYMFGVKR